MNIGVRAPFILMEMSLLRSHAFRLLSLLLIIAGCNRKPELQVSVEELERKLGSQLANDRWEAFTELRKTDRISDGRLRELAVSENKHLRNGAARLLALKGMELNQLCARLKAMLDRHQGHWDAFLWQSAGCLDDFPAGVEFRDLRLSLEAQGLRLHSEEPMNDWGRLFRFDLTPRLGVDLGSVRCVLRVRVHPKEDRMEERNVGLVGRNEADWSAICGMKGLECLAKVMEHEEAQEVRNPNTLMKQCEVYGSQRFMGFSSGEPLIEVASCYQVELKFQRDQKGEDGITRVDARLRARCRSSLGPLEGWATWLSPGITGPHGEPERVGVGGSTYFLPLNR